MAFYQIIIMYSIVFAGEYFYPEPEQEHKYDRPDDPYVYPGRIEDWDGTPLWSRWKPKHGASRHMSNVFNIFVVMQIFILINVRTIHDEFNVFKGLFKNGTFWIFFLC